MANHKHTRNEACKIEADKVAQIYLSEGLTYHVDHWLNSSVLKVATVYSLLHSHNPTIAHTFMSDLARARMHWRPIAPNRAPKPQI